MSKAAAPPRPSPSTAPGRTCSRARPRSAWRSASKNWSAATTPSAPRRSSPPASTSSTGRSGSTTTRPPARRPASPSRPGRAARVFMDTYAMQAAWHMQAYGTTQRQIAVGASKNHHHGSLNPKAQYRFESQRGRGAGRPRDQLPADARDVLAAGRWCGRRAAVLGRRAGELPARGARARGARPHQPAVRRQVPPARRTGAVAHRRRQGLCPLRAEASRHAPGRGARRHLVLRDLPAGDAAPVRRRPGRALRRIGRHRAGRAAAGECLRRAGVQGPPGGRHGAVDGLRGLPAAARRGRRAAGQGARRWA